MSIQWGGSLLNADVYHFDRVSLLLALNNSARQMAPSAAVRPRVAKCIRLGGLRFWVPRTQLLCSAPRAGCVLAKNRSNCCRKTGQ